jgi:hypothetical protein
MFYVGLVVVKKVLVSMVVVMVVASPARRGLGCYLFPMLFPRPTDAGLLNRHVLPSALLCSPDPDSPRLCRLLHHRLLHRFALGRRALDELLQLELLAGFRLHL